MMKSITMIIISILVLSCGTKNNNLTKFYSKDRRSLLLLTTDSTFVFQNYLSSFNTQGTLMGNFKKISSNKICVTNIIDRMNIDIKEMNLENDSIPSVKIFVDEINNVNYENIEIYIESINGDIIRLATLSNGLNEFNLPISYFNSNLKYQFLFKYKKERGLILKTKFDIVKSKMFTFDNKKRYLIKFNFFYFDLDNISSDKFNCFTLTKNYYNITDN